MEENEEYRQKLIAEYKRQIEPLLRYLPWLAQHNGMSVSSVYQGAETEQLTMKIPVYDGTLLTFVKLASKSPLMDRNYRYVYSRKRIQSHDDERKLITQATWKDWDTLRGILSYYVMGGRTKGSLWNEAVKEAIFYMVLSQMKEIVEYWDQPIEVGDKH